MFLGGQSCASEFDVPGNSTCSDSYLDNFNGSDWDSNLYWNYSGVESPNGFAKNVGWAQWRAAGHDLKSLVSDPMFVDPDDGEFKLQESSPAFKLGYVEWNIKSVGPRAAAASEVSV